MARDLGKPLMGFSRAAEALLQKQVFPGNVRMLKNAVERAAILCGGGEIDADDLSFELFEIGPGGDGGFEQMVQCLSGDQMSLSACEQTLLREALRRTEGNQVQAARASGCFEDGFEAQDEAVWIALTPLDSQ